MGVSGLPSVAWVVLPVVGYGASLCRGLRASHGLFPAEGHVEDTNHEGASA